MFLFAKDVQEILGVSRNYVYVIIRELNVELAKQGHRAEAGRGQSFVRKSALTTSLRFIFKT